MPCFIFSVGACVLQFFFGHVCPPRSTHTATMPVLAGSVHTHIPTKSFRAGAVVSCSGLVGLGVATCVGTYMAGLCFEKRENVST